MDRVLDLDLDLPFEGKWKTLGKLPKMYQISLPFWKWIEITLKNVFQYLNSFKIFFSVTIAFSEHLERENVLKCTHHFQT